MRSFLPVQLALLLGESVVEMSTTVGRYEIQSFNVCTARV